MIVALTFAFLAITLTVGTEKMAQSLVTILLNIIVFFGILASINYGVPKMPAIVAGCIIILAVSTFYQNGLNEKTICAFYSVLIVTALTFAFAYVFISHGNLQGFPIAQNFKLNPSNGYTDDIDANMLTIFVATTLIVMVGSTVDTSLSVSSALSEVYKHDPSMTERDLVSSAMSIGKNIVSSTVNTLFFIFISEFLTVFVYLIKYTSFEYAVNSKEMAQQVVFITIAATASVIAIPITAVICGKKYIRK